MSLNLYDLLDVEETASTDEIRAAWKSAVADLDPTDRRFRAYNDAAAVLLDAERRSAYDADLAAARADDPAEDSAEDPAGERPEAERAEDDDADDAVVVVATETDSGKADSATTDGGEADGTTDGSETESATTGTRQPGQWSLLLAGVFAVLGVVVAAWVLSLPGVRDTESPADVAAAAEVVAEASTSAQVAARESIVPLLGYDYRTMGDDLVRIQGRMTERMGARQAESWDALTEEARKQQIVVTAEAPYVALTRVDSSGERAEVVAFIDQLVKKKGAEPFTLQMWATLTLVRDGDDWLLDDICTEGDCT